MLYNQIQILVGAVLARRYAMRLSTIDTATQTG
jgi:sodium/bile acid cotransporter 7